MTMQAGQSAIVTGAARGFGFAIAKALANAGVSVMLTDRDAQALETAVSELSRAGAKAAGAVLDVTSEAQWEEAVAVTIARFGGFDTKAQAWNACEALKKKSYGCFALNN